MINCPLETCSHEVAIPGQFCSAECYSEWLSVRLYEATGSDDPFSAHLAVVPIKLDNNETPPLPLRKQPWYRGFVMGGSA